MRKIYLIICIVLCAVFQAQIVNIPDANFKAKLLSANTTNQIIARNLSGAAIIIDTNGDSEIQVSEAQNVGELILGGAAGYNMNIIASLTGIKSFTNLKKITASNFAQVQFIDFGNMTSLQNITVEQNNALTSLDIHGTGATMVIVKNNSNLTTIDAHNSSSLGNFDCSYNNLQNLNVSGLTSMFLLTATNNHLNSIDLSGLTNLYEANFLFNNIASINLQNNNALEILNLNYNSLSSMPLTATPNLKYLGISGCNFSTLDLSHFPLLVGLVATGNPFSVLDATQNPKLVSINCSGCPNLQKLLLKNGLDNNVPTSTYFYSCPNLSYICADDFETAGIMTFITSQGYNCTINSYCSFIPGGVNYTIQGNTKYDGNNNGCDVNDSNKAFQKFNITNGTVSGSLIANASGNHSIAVGAGSHTITPVIENPSYFNISPTSLTANFPTQTSPLIQNFCLSANGTHNDLEAVIIPITAARPGFSAKYKIVYKNKGTGTQSGTLSFNYNDNLMDFSSSSVTVNSQSTGLLNWNFSNLLPFETREITVTFTLNTPTQTPPLNGGVVLNYTTQINGATDETPLDNTFTLNQTVVNSFDPNDKTCLEGTSITQAKVGDYVHYVIRFENTGTANAQNIVVKDEIDTSKFDLSTLIPLNSSHNFITRTTSPNTVEFIFENIQLPYAAGNNGGYVSFKIKTKSTLNIGDSFSNTAKIYFDYNAPIVTNTYTTTVQNVLSTSEMVSKNNEVSIYPNPVKEVLNIQSKNEIVKAEIYDASGRILSSASVKENSMNVSELAKGNYIIKLSTKDKTFVQKFIKN
ncbi:T9SS type A sorting domain-containing protein [Chryseobacterium sp. PS-8]|uniref:T9SS type A sorting domain-containing protein n=1 Tax=Chryseobacterium indicum TaxID=2766954 RepID=A0ABS9C6S4_9FLAO|nr:T9SS type A sorting domain-containing protein [Chryseobacterium sp. PS-8]MCF2219983.1 T9SS type A sorting domain-containing protein [Chryseobacterium sp. PS-8]